MTDLSPALLRFGDVSVRLSVELGRTNMPLRDVLSPCVTFNYYAVSSMSYTYIREHLSATATMDFVPEEQEITVDYAEGKSTSVVMHDGSLVQLHKLSPHWDPTNRRSAMERVQQAKQDGEVLTGLLYLDPDSQELHDTLDTVDEPLNTLREDILIPSSEALDSINEAFR